MTKPWEAKAPAPSSGISPPMLMGERPVADPASVRPLAPPVMGRPAERAALIGRAMSVHRRQQAIFGELDEAQRAKLIALARKTLMSHVKDGKG